MYKIIFMTGWALTCFWACDATPACPFKPMPIFESGLPHVKIYNFEKQGTQSLESLYLDADVHIEIYQNVCPSTTQEFKFMVKGDFRHFPDSMWMKEAVRQFVFLSSLSPKQKALKDWADIVELRRGDMKLGEEREVQPGVFVKIDKVVGPDRGDLLVTLIEKEHTSSE
jgi:hypothetical protein